MTVAVILTARASWAKLEPVCRALRQRPNVDLKIIACASALLERYGAVVNVVKAQGYEVAAECWTTYEGANLVTSAKETGTLLLDLAGILRALSPDNAVVCADRHEVLAAAQAVSYLHIPLVHIQGGERTGSIDDKVRDSITSLADYHCVSTEFAKYRVYCLTGAWDNIHHTGCPSIDIAKQSKDEPPVTLSELGGSGADMDLNQPFLVVMQHPVTNESDQAMSQMLKTLHACSQIDMPKLVFFSGQDAGTDGTQKAIRMWLQINSEEPWHTVRNLPPLRFLRLLTQASVLVGNSSAGIREASYLGVPVVNVGTRQQGRERAGNVRSVPHDHVLIQHALEQQIAHGRYPSSTLYGDGTAGEQIADVICHVGVERAGYRDPVGVRPDGAEPVGEPEA